MPLEAAWILACRGGEMIWCELVDEIWVFSTARVANRIAPKVRYLMRSATSLIR
jgi:hypothetical protein